MLLAKASKSALSIWHTSTVFCFPWTSHMSHRCHSACKVTNQSRHHTEITFSLSKSLRANFKLLQLRSCCQRLSNDVTFFYSTIPSFHHHFMITAKTTRASTVHPSEHCFYILFQLECHFELRYCPLGKTGFLIGQNDALIESTEKY